LLTATSTASYLYELTGLLYYRARFYDPQLGRFISEDPAGFAGGLNLYAYVGDDPVDDTDPQGRWPSQYGWKYHQEITRRALKSIGVNPRDIEIIAFEQGPFDAATQNASLAYIHAMSKPGEDPSETPRRHSNQFVREQICRARKLASRGDRIGALKLLSHALHTLQDSKSPAHANFQPAWPNTYRQMAKHRGHYWNEWFDPGAGSEADLITIRGWKYFTGELPMPDDFFGNAYDLPKGKRGYFNSNSAPDGTSCDCYD
jgi:RHS repeat-associated protein